MAFEFTVRLNREINMKVKVSAFLMLLSLAFVCKSEVDIKVCDIGGAAANKGNHKLAVIEFTKCLSIDNLDQEFRARAYQARAWSHFNLNNGIAAVEDQEASFKLVTPKNYNEFINYASYLRRIERYEDSIKPLKAAIAIDEKNSRVWMMTLYNLGWSLQELQRYQESIEAFTKGIPAQPDFPFVYWRRGLSYHSLGMRDEAKRDFQEYKIQIEKSTMEVPPALKQEITEILSLYKLNK